MSFRLPGHDRTSFSTNCLPMKPVAPVIKTVFLLKNSAMPLASVLADISEQLNKRDQNMYIRLKSKKKMEKIDNINTKQIVSLFLFHSNNNALAIDHNA